VAHVDTYEQFRAEERTDFRERAVIWVRRPHHHLFRDVAACTARSADSCEFAPSVWRITSQDMDPFIMAPMLRIFTRQAPRRLDDFAFSYAARIGPLADRQYLAGLLDSLTPRTSYSCSFQPQYLATLPPLPMLVLERLMQVVANLRRLICESRPSEPALTQQDYGAVRVILTNLPLTPIDRTVSAHAIDTADKVFKAIHSTGHQLSLPDRSGEGHHWFTRADVARWTELGYTTAKKQLQELEDDGIVVSTVAENNRDHGRQIHFRFAESRAPPFRWKNPFETLPDLPGM
jgi:hypothetical protein